MPSLSDPGGVLRLGGRGNPGDRLGKYTLVCRLAIGGMAEIFLARAQGIGGFEKLVVLKRILPQYAHQDEFVAMFLAEARLTATLSHPNIANVYDIGTVDDFYFFTMEYVHGEDLNQIGKALVRAGRPFPLEHAVTIIQGICGGLHHAHEARGTDGLALGIVHRDVSPSNVLVAYDGSVKLVDFGIAKMTSRSANTRVGTLKGKISYMSPEQCRGEPLDRRSDVFAIGILLYEATTGHRLFPGENEFAVLQSIVHQDVAPPSTLVPGYPPMLENIVMMALNRNPDERYETAQDLQVDLEAFARHKGLTTSAVQLAKLMQELFGRKLAAWNAAQRDGKSLADFLSSAMVRGINESSDTSLPPEGRTPTSAIKSRAGKRSSALPFEVPLLLGLDDQGGLGAGADDDATVMEIDGLDVEVERGSGRGWLVAIAVLAIAAGGGIYAWHRLQPSSSAAARAPTAPARGLTVEPIGVPAPPSSPPVAMPVAPAAAAPEAPVAAAADPEPSEPEPAVDDPAAGVDPAPTATSDKKRRKHRPKRDKRARPRGGTSTPSDPDSPFED